MQHFTPILRTTLATVFAATLIACGGQDDHDHDHDHDDSGSEEHAHPAPHADEGGVLVELDEHVANVEFMLDAETGTLTMYTLDGHAEKSIRSKSESVVITVEIDDKTTFDVTLAAQANSLSGETVGDSSKFVGQDDGLKGVEHFDGTIKELALKDANYLNVTFDFPDEHDEDGEDHDGEDHDDHDHDSEH